MTNEPLSTSDLVTLKEPDDTGMKLFAVVEGDVFRIEPPESSPFCVYDLYPLHQEYVKPLDSESWRQQYVATCLECERVQESYRREWVVLWTRNKRDALARAAQYDQGSYHLDALVNT